MTRWPWVLLALVAAAIAWKAEASPGAPAVPAWCLWKGPDSLACVFLKENLPEELRPCAFPVLVTPDGGVAVHQDAPDPPPTYLLALTCDAKES